jgi:hypothetical protein
MTTAYPSAPTVMSLARIIGPALAGALLLAVPVEAVFWINGASFVAVIGTLLAVKAGAAPPAARGRGRSDLREAVAYVRGDGAVRSLLILAVVPMVFGFPYASLMPLFARDLLHLGPAGFGGLLAVAAAGALARSAWLSLPGRGRRAGPGLVGSTLAFGLGLLAFTVSPSAGVAAVALFLTGLAGQVYRTTSRVTLQSTVSDHLRGRILSIALMDRGFIPVGTVLLGTVADAAGAAWAGAVMGGGCLVVTLAVVALRRQIWWL